MSAFIRLINATRTTRPGRSILLFLTVMAGFSLLEAHWSDAVFRATPMLFVCLAGFCINDIFDQEQDRINHPERALSQYPALAGTVTAIYIGLFIAAVASISMQDRPNERFIWAVFFIFLANYNFFKRTLPMIKNIYVSATACLPPLILDLAKDDIHSAPIAYLPLVLIVFARELSCDIPDAPGDVGTLAKILSPRQGEWLVTCLFLTALGLMFLLAEILAHRVSFTIASGAFGIYLMARMILSSPVKPLFPFTGAMAVAASLLVIM